MTRIASINEREKLDADVEHYVLVWGMYETG